MKAKIGQGGIGTYEVWVKENWFTPYKPVYDGMFPFRGTYKEALKIKEYYNNKK